MFRRSRPLAPLVVLLTMAACAYDALQTATEGATARPLIHCGEQRVGLGNPDAASRRCFAEAYASGELAVLVEHATTIEGAPVVRTYRTLGNELIEVVHDGRRDPLFGGRVERVLCRLVPVNQANRELGMKLPPEYVFFEIDCREA